MKRAFAQEDLLEPIIVDSFAGGGGASTGIELATGRIVNIAIDHDPAAIRMHKTNHPHTEHLQASVWDVDPVEVCRGRPVGLAWFSPDCRHFSRAKGAAPVERSIRGLAWIELRWAAKVRPALMITENVEEFLTWGPVRRGKPVKSKAGRTFRKWKGQLEALGYRVEWRILTAADYGAPTTRRRLVIVARCDGKPIVWPERTHAPRDSEEVRSGRCKPWRSAAEILDWSLPCPSVFASKAEIRERYGVNAKRPLADNTLRRVIRGVDKFTIKSGSPFIASNRYGLVSANLVEYYGNGNPLDVTQPLRTVTSHDREALTTAIMQPFHAGGYHGRGNSPDMPVNTITGAGAQSLVCYHVCKFKGTDLGQSPGEPLQTVTARSNPFADVRAILVKYAPGVDLGDWPQVRELLNRYCGYHLADNEVLLLSIGGAWYYIADIGLRMLMPRELYNAMGFPPDYIIDYDYIGNPCPRTDQVARCGNAVCPPMAAAVVRANWPEAAVRDIVTMAELERRVAV